MRAEILLRPFESARPLPPERVSLEARLVIRASTRALHHAAASGNG